MTNSPLNDADSIEWTTDQGSDVTVEADNGRLFVTLAGDDVSFRRQRAELTSERGMDVLDAGRQRDDSGERFNAFIPVDDRREELKALQEESVIEPTDEPLAFEVEERTKTTSTGGWGEREITTQRLTATKRRAEMTERQTTLLQKIDAERDVPEDAEAGDVFAIDELLDDARTPEERDEDALDEAAETDEEVVISRTTTDCDDPNKECTLDRVTRVATPEGEIEARRTHTY